MNKREQRKLVIERLNKTHSPTAWQIMEALFGENYRSSYTGEKAKAVLLELLTDED